MGPPVPHRDLASRLNLSRPSSVPSGQLTLAAAQEGATRDRRESMQKFHCLTSEVSVWFKFNFVGQAEDARCHQDICFAARLLIGSTDLTGERHPARCHSHADAFVGNGEIPVERIQDGPSYLIVATRLPFTVQTVQGFVAEFRRIATCMEGERRETSV